MLYGRLPHDKEKKYITHYVKNFMLSGDGSHEGSATVHTAIKN